MAAEDEEKARRQLEQEILPAETPGPPAGPVWIAAPSMKRKPVIPVPAPPPPPAVPPEPEFELPDASADAPLLAATEESGTARDEPAHEPAQQPEPDEAEPEHAEQNLAQPAEAAPEPEPELLPETESEGAPESALHAEEPEHEAGAEPAEEHEPAPETAAPPLVARGPAPEKTRLATRLAPPLAARAVDRLGSSPSRSGRMGTWAFLVALLLLVAAGAWLWHKGTLDPLLARIQPIIARLEGRPSASAPPPGSASGMVLEIKQLLAKLDFPPGPIDDKMDPATEAAIRSYQEAAGEPVTGQPSQALLQELRAVAADQQASGG